jgi:hypothetical protein
MDQLDAAIDHIQPNQSSRPTPCESFDVARATGQSTDLDPELGEQALAWGRANLKPEFRRPGTFAPEVPVPGTAPIYDRVAGWFGRDPAWSPL